MFEYTSSNTIPRGPLEQCLLPVPNRELGVTIGGFDGLLFSVCGLMGPNMGLVQLAETLMNSETFTQRFTDLWPS